MRLFTVQDLARADLDRLSPRGRAGTNDPLFFHVRGSFTAWPAYTLPLSYSSQDTYRHIIRPLRIMSIQALPLLILWRNPIQRITHIGPNIAIPVLVHRQCTARMLQEQVE